MPTLARFDGIKIQIFHEDHPPPHFHAVFGEHNAALRIDTLEVLDGFLPRPQLRTVRAWARTRQTELMRAWDQCLADQMPDKIP